VSPRTILAAALAAAAALCVLAPDAGAHATLERSVPERGAVLDRPPAKVELGFDEPVEAAFGAVRVFDAAGEQVGTGPVTRPGGDGSRIAVALPRSLPDGAYTVTFRVVSSDGHPVQGGLTFVVGDAASAPADVATLLAGAQAGPVTRAALGTARGLGYAAIAVALGALGFLAVCWRPAARGDAALQAAPEAPLARLVGGAVAVGAGAGAAAVVLQAAAAGGTSAWAALDPAVVEEMLGTRSGAWLGVRVAAWAALALALLALRRHRTRWAAALAALPAALVAAGPALAGHAAAQRPAALLAPLDVAHVAGAAAWAGGLVALLVAVPPVTRRLPPPERSRVLAGVLERFSRLALWSVVALAAAGAAQAAIHLGWRLAPLAETGFGRSLLVKSALLAALLAIAALQRRRTLPGLRAHAAGGEAPGGAGVLLRRALRAEVALLAGVLAATAVLAGSPPPRAAAAQAGGPFSADVAIGPQRLQLTVDPARTGANEVHVYVLDGRSGAPFTGSEELRVTAELPAKAIGPLDLQATRAGPGHWVVTGAALAPPGTWRLVVANRVSDFDEHTARVEVPIR